ncbi:jg17103 [Pararge aegeria aegeria]|uniref:Enhancer of polycomb-like protein n=1 Tax=Pararge aegeria aegeria TaxID=348720 RepID=A0A8S4R3N3_9NEOP|nr:jg17103 [Pararge aegeria aegeria]
MSKLSFRARALDASKPMPIYLAEELPDLPDYSAINRAVPQMPSGMEKEEESEHHLQRAISGTGLIIPTPEVCQVSDVEFYERCYPPDYKMPKQHIHMQPLWEEQETPEYDIDTEDERWLKQQRRPELTELKFEQMMDKLEKCSGQTVVTLNEAKMLLERHDDLVIAVYDYWLNKRLNTQHPLILSVKTEGRPGQSTNNPYLAFRRRTEKMQTRKNRKNDESSYEKMLKLRRDLARALTLLELVARRERAKRELVKLTALLSERRYVAGDFASQLLPDPPPRTQYTAVPLTSASFRRDYTVQHYPPRAPPTPVDQPRQREKRPYKRRKHRHHQPTAHPHRDSGVCTSSEEEAAPPDDGPFAFRRKPGCFYEMPTSTLYGEPLDPDNPSKDGLFEHEMDQRTRFTLTSINYPYPRCIGFARRRLGRGGRLVLDRIATPLDDLWPNLPFRHAHSSEDRARRDEEVDLETKPHRTPKEITRDYHTGGKHPWRHAFRKHLAKNPHLWTEPVKTDAVDLKLDKFDVDDIKIDVDDVKIDVDDVKIDVDDVRLEVDSVKTSDDAKPSDVTDVKIETMDVDDKVLPESDSVIANVSDSAFSVSDKARTIDSAVRGNLERVIRKRSWSGCSDSSYDSDESLQPVEREFEKFINEVNKKWLHFRPKTPPPSPPYIQKPADYQIPIALDTPISVELTSEPPSGALDTFTTAEFTLGDLYGGINPEVVKSPVPTSKIIVEEVNEVPQVKIERKRPEDTLEEIQLTRGVQLKTVQTKHSPLKKHIITSATHRRGGDVTVVTSDAQQPQIVTVAVSDSLKVRLQNQATACSSAGTVVGLLQNGPFTAVALPVHNAQHRDMVSTSVASVANVVTMGTGKATNVTNVSTIANATRRVSGPLVQLAPASLGHKPLQLHHHPSVVVTPQMHHVNPSKLKVLHAHPLTHTQRAQLLAQNRTLGQLPAVVSLAALGDSKPPSAALLKAAPGSVAQFFEIKSGQLGKGPHLVNVLRQPPPVKANVAFNDAKKRQVVFDGTLKGNVATTARPHRVSLSVDGRQIVRAALPSVRAPHVRHQIQLKNRTLQVTAPIARSASEPSTSITIAPSKTASIPSSMVANLLQKNVQLPKGQKIAISGPGGQALSANVQAIAFTTAQLKARQGRLIAQPRPTPVAEIVESSSAPTTSSNSANINADVATDGDDSATNGVRRRATDTLPMEVT